MRRDDCQLEPSSALRLQSWLSPALPTGAFSYSHGIEHAAQRGLVCDAASLSRWLDADLRHGSAWNDAVFFSAIWKAARARDHEALLSLAEQAAAFRGTAELALEASRQGAAALKVLKDVWPSPLLDRLAANLTRRGIAPVLVVVMASRLAAEGAALPIALATFLQSYVSNLVSAAIRIIGIGQTAGQRVIANLEATVLAVSSRALNSTLDDLGSATAMLDVMSILHETQETRLFTS